MTYAIVVKLIPATETKPRRFKTTWGNKTLIMSDTIGDFCPYYRVANELLKSPEGLNDSFKMLSLGWSSAWINETTKVFVKN